MSVIQQYLPLLSVYSDVVSVHDSNVLRNSRWLSYNTAQLSLRRPAGDVPPPLIEAVQQVIAQLDLASLEGVRNVLKFTVGTVVARHGQYFSLIKRMHTDCILL
jgi:hypothetical protein